MTRPVLRDSGPAPHGAGLSRRLLLSASSSAAALMPALALGKGQPPGPSARGAGADPHQAAVFAPTINNQRRQLAIDPRTTLLDALRENLGLTGREKRL